MGFNSGFKGLTLTENALPVVDVTKNIRISKYIQHELPCMIWSEMCLVYIVALLSNIKPTAFSTCLSVSTYRARKYYVSE